MSGQEEGALQSFHSMKQANEEQKLNKQSKMIIKNRGDGKERL